MFNNSTSIVLAPISFAVLSKRKWQCCHIRKTFVADSLQIIIQCEININTIQYINCRVFYKILYFNWFSGIGMNNNWLLNLIPIIMKNRCFSNNLNRTNKIEPNIPVIPNSNFFATKDISHNFLVSSYQCYYCRSMLRVFGTTSNTSKRSILACYNYTSKKDD